MFPSNKQKSNRKTKQAKQSSKQYRPPGKVNTRVAVRPSNLSSSFSATPSGTSWSSKRGRSKLAISSTSNSKTEKSTTRAGAKQQAALSSANRVRPFASIRAKQSNTNDDDNDDEEYDENDDDDGDDDEMGRQMMRMLLGQGPETRALSALEQQQFDSNQSETTVQAIELNTRSLVQQFRDHMRVERQLEANCNQQVSDAIRDTLDAVDRALTAAFHKPLPK